MANRNIDDIQKSLAGLYDGLDGGFATKRSVAYNTVRNEYNHSNYYRARPSEGLPSSDRAIMLESNAIYYENGIIRNMIDMMADFCVKGIDWAHKNRNIQAFYRTWWRKIGGYDVSERFCNYLARLGNIAIYTNYLKVPENVAIEWRKTKGSEFKNVVTSSRKIPSKYVFVDITSLTELYPELGRFTSNRTFILSLSGGLTSLVNTNAYHTEKSYDISKIIEGIPSDLRDKIIKNDGKLIFTEGDLKIFHYKKDDWDSWARPLIYSIMEPLRLLKKMHLADMSALDGAISSIRLWKVGYIDQNNVLNSIIPTKSMLAKVRELVLSNLGGGTLDIFWGPDLDFKESASEAYKFLTNDKYKHVMTMIYDGMGIPPALAGGGGSGDVGFTNNFISMKVLIEKLNYLRNKLTEFWTEEAKVVQKAMGFSSPASITYDDAILSDEAQYKKLLIDLYDRDIISIEGLREEFDIIDPIESGRILREEKRRKSNKVPEKSSPYHNPLWKKKFETELIRDGIVDPTIIGIEATIEDIEDTKGGPSDGGRPLGAKDREKRKTKIVRPRTSAEDLLAINTWAKESFGKISEVVTPLYVSEKSKTYARDLSNDEVSELENLKLSILATFNPFDEINEDTIKSACLNITHAEEYKIARDSILDNFINKFNRKPTIDDKRIAAAAAYSLLKM